MFIYLPYNRTKFNLKAFTKASNADQYQSASVCNSRCHGAYMLLYVVASAIPIRYDIEEISERRGATTDGYGTFYFPWQYTPDRRDRCCLVSAPGQCNHIYKSCHIIA